MNRMAWTASATSAFRNQIVARRSLPRAGIHSPKSRRVSGSVTTTVADRI
jgi:hypothetical protein